jgi:isopentenyl-diphosphate delta-isomerase
MNEDKTVQRKIEHIDLCINSEVEYSKSAGFEKYEFKHNAVTSISYEKLDLSRLFLDKKIDFPFIISSMTGGANESLNINKKLAEVAACLNIPIGAGSQRHVLESNTYDESFSVLRKIAPNVPIFSNLGISEVISLYNSNQLNITNKLVELLESDAFYIHLNTAQELFQVEGNKDFSNLLESIAELVNTIKIPVFIKEVGNGIDYNAAKQLLELGVKGIDVAGSGGTNWQLIEMKRSGIINEEFLEWGLPTTYCVKEVNKLKTEYDFFIIASGGIKSGIDIAKSFALGADFAASANIILKSIINSGVDLTVKNIKDWFDDVKRVMFLTNANRIEDLRNDKLIKIGELY